MASPVMAKGTEVMKTPPEMVVKETHHIKPWATEAADPKGTNAPRGVLQEAGKGRLADLLAFLQRSCGEPVLRVLCVPESGGGGGGGSPRGGRYCLLMWVSVKVRQLIVELFDCRLGESRRSF